MELVNVCEMVQNDVEVAARRPSSLESTACSATSTPRRRPASATPSAVRSSSSVAFTTRYLRGQGVRARREGEGEKGKRKKEKERHGTGARERVGGSIVSKLVLSAVRPCHTKAYTMAAQPAHTPP